MEILIFGHMRQVHKITSAELTFCLSASGSDFLMQVMGEPNGVGPGKGGACCHPSFTVDEEPNMPAVHEDPNK
jgi:hypothetical protein